MPKTTFIMIELGISIAQQDQRSVRANPPNLYPAFKNQGWGIHSAMVRALTSHPRVQDFFSKWADLDSVMSGLSLFVCCPSSKFFFLASSKTNISKFQFDLNIQDLHEIVLPVVCLLSLNNNVIILCFKFIAYHRGQFLKYWPKVPKIP